MYYPELPLEPPEDTNDKVAFRCNWCGNEILEGEEFYDIPLLKRVCTTCMDNWHHYDAEPDFAYAIERDEEDI